MTVHKLVIHIPILMYSLHTYVQKSSIPLEEAMKMNSLLHTQMEKSQKACEILMESPHHTPCLTCRLSPPP